MKLQGRVEMFDRVQGFGFLSRDDGRGRVLVRARDLHDVGIYNLEVGQQLRFDIGPAPKDGRPRAVGVRRGYADGIERRQQKMF